MDKNLFIYMPSGSGIERDALEDALEDHFAGRIEVIGGGTGLGFTNYDLELINENPHELLNDLKDFLKACKVPPGTFIQYEHEKRMLH